MLQTRSPLAYKMNDDELMELLDGQATYEDINAISNLNPYKEFDNLVDDDH